MIHKYAKVINGEYQEWSEDHGPAQPAVKNENIEQIKDKSFSVRGENIKMRFTNITNCRGMKIA